MFWLHNSKYSEFNQHKLKLDLRRLPSKLSRYLWIMIDVPEGIHKKHCQLWVSIGDIRCFHFFVRQSFYNFAKSKKRFIDICSFLGHLSLRFWLFQSLASSKVNKRYLSVPFYTSSFTTNFPHNINSHQRVTSWRIFVELVTSWFSVPDSLVQDSDQVINTCTVHNNQILNKKSICRVPSAVKHSWTRVE